LVNRREPFASGKLFIDFKNGDVRIDGNPVKLTVTEFEILRCLVNNASRSMSQSQLAHLIKGDYGQCSRKTSMCVYSTCAPSWDTPARNRGISLASGPWDTSSPSVGVYTPILLEPGKPAMILAGLHLSADIAVGWYTLSTLSHTCGKETSQTI